jgi:hypothetical protein
LLIGPMRRSKGRTVWIGGYRERKCQESRSLAIDMGISEDVMENEQETKGGEEM